MSPLLRVVGLLAALMTGAVAIAGMFAEGASSIAALASDLAPGKREIAFSVIVSGAISLLLLFCRIFWMITDKIRGSGAALPLLLAVQLLIAVFFPDLMFIVACEAGYILAGRSGIRIYALAALLLAVMVLPGTMGRLYPPEFARMPMSAEIGFAIVQAFAWQLFAFAAGHAAGREAARRSLVIVGSDPQSAQQLVGDPKRISKP